MTKNFLEILNEVTENKYEYLRLSKAVYYKKESSISITLLVPYNVFGKGFKDEDKEFIHTKINEHFKDKFKISFSYEKSYCNEEILMNAIVKYFESNKPSIILYLKKNDIEIIFGADSVEISISIYKEMKLSFDNGNVLRELKDYLSHLFCDEFFIKYNLKEEEYDLSDVVPSTVDDSILSSIINGIPVTNVKSIVGGAILSRPVSIKSSKLLKDDITVCGIITRVKRIMSKKNKPFYILTISDGSGTCEIKSFSKLEKDTDVSKLEEGTKILVSGKLSVEVNEKYRSTADVSLIADKISKCDYDEKDVSVEDVYKKNPQHYITVFPETYKSYEQSSMVAVENAIPPYLSGKSFIIFDLETTGISSQDAIIEIGAVKMVDGKLKDTFSTLVNPMRPIPKSASDVNNIFDYMVQNSPKIEAVIPDFYKFCEGSVIISYNIAFDMPFIKRDGEKCGYKFDHQTICALKCAQKYIKSKNHKLATIVNTLGISLIDAHRALADAIAAAKVFIKVSEYL